MSITADSLSVRDWSAKFRIAQKTYELHRFEQSTALFGEAIQIAAQLDLTEEFIVTSLFYGLSHKRIGNSKKAVDIFRRALNYMEGTRFQNTEEHMFICAELGLLLLAGRDFPGARQHLTQSINIQSLKKYRMHEDFYAFYFGLLVCHVIDSSWEEADKLSRFAYARSKKQLGADHGITVTALAWCMVVASRLGNDQRSRALESQFGICMTTMRSKLTPALTRTLRGILDYRKRLESGPERPPGSSA